MMRTIRPPVVDGLFSARQMKRHKGLRRALYGAEIYVCRVHFHFDTKKRFNAFVVPRGAS